MSAADKKKLDGIEAGSDSIPVGAIIYYAKKATPGNYLICNGAAVSRTTYATLFGVIGTTYGTGDGSTTFNVPNLIDRFPQGNATPGTVKNAGLPNITGKDDIGWSGEHEGVIGNDNGGDSISGCFLGTKNSRRSSFGGARVDNANNVAVPRGVAFDASKSNAIYGKSSTVQPPALTLVPCIRYA